MVTPSQCLAKYGPPEKESNMVLWDVPAELEIGVIPKRLYCNKDIVEPLKKAFENLIRTDCSRELKTFDGCFNLRAIRGYEKQYLNFLKKGMVAEALKLVSIHSWGIAIDVNAFENGLNQTPKLSVGFVRCFTDAGFDWGGTWKRKDGMHFQLSKI